MHQDVLRRAQLDPEVLQRAQSLVDDPGYPSADILNRVAQRLLGK